MRQTPLMLVIDNISCSIAGRPLFAGASARIPAGHKVGIVGANGSGKTTLFRLIRGEIEPESGTITLPVRTRTGGVDQEVPASETSLLETVLAADHERAALMVEAETASAPARIAEIQTRLAEIDAWSAEARASAILRGLGFSHEEQLRPCATFSGGWRMRVALAGVLFSAPDLLLLDEPTNYLDLEGALWLESYLARYPHTVLVISHDRGLLNRVSGSILHLENRRLALYQGNYDSFARTRAEQRTLQEAEARRQAAQRARIQGFVDRFRYKASKAKQAQSRLKMLAKMQPVATPEQATRHRFTFPDPEDALSPPIICMEGASVGYDNRPVLRNLDLGIDHDDRIALLGRNGEGKSTLAKLIAGRLPPMAGSVTRARKLRVGFFAQHQSEELTAGETPLAHLRRALPDAAPPALRARLAGFGLGAEQAETPVARLSGGQRARLTLLLATLHAPHLLILDEPTNHLDIESREALVEALTPWKGAVILVSHDMHLLNLLADRLWLVEGGRVREWRDDLETYRRHLLNASPQRKAGTRKSRSAVTPRPSGTPVRPSRERMQALRADLRRCEARLDKLAQMRDKLSQRLADPAIYAAESGNAAEPWQRKYAEVMDAIERAEALWMAAAERLEKAERDAG